MAEKSTVIRDQIEETKSEINQDLASLERQVRITVDGTIEGVKEGLQKMSPAHLMQQYPLWSLGGSVVAGAAMGGWMATRSHGVSAPAPRGKTASARRGRLNDEIQFLKGVFLTSAVKSFGRVVKDSLPSIRDQVEEVVNHLISKLEEPQQQASEARENYENEWAPAASQSPTSE